MSSSVYRRFLVGAFVANVGSWMQSTAQGWLVLDLTDSPALLGLTSAASSAPVLVLSLWAGVLADRVDRRRLLVAAQLASSLLAATLAILTMSGLVAFWQVLLIAALAGSSTAIAMPAFQAIVSTIVPPGTIGNAVALNSAQFNVSRIVGPSLAGTAIALGGLALAFWSNALALVVIAFVLATLRIPRSGAVAQVEASMWSNLLDGLRYVRANPTIAALVLLAAVPALFVLNYLALLPVYARDILGIGAPGLGMLTAAIGFGALSGSLGIAVLRPGGGGGPILLGGLALAATSVMVFGASRSLPLSLVALAVLGASQVSYYATTNTLIQLLVPGRLRGRVLSLYVLTSLGGIPFGNLYAGAVAERFGAPAALVVGGALTLVLLAVAALAAPGLRRVSPAAASPAPPVTADPTPRDASSPASASTARPTPAPALASASASASAVDSASTVASASTARPTPAPAMASASASASSPEDR